MILVNDMPGTLAVKEETMKESVYFLLRKYILGELFVEWVVSCQIGKALPVMIKMSCRFYK